MSHARGSGACERAFIGTRCTYGCTVACGDSPTRRVGAYHPHSVRAAPRAAVRYPPIARSADLSAAISARVRRGGPAGARAGGDRGRARRSSKLLALGCIHAARDEPPQPASAAARREQRDPHCASRGPLPAPRDASGMCTRKRGATAEHLAPTEERGQRAPGLSHAAPRGSMVPGTSPHRNGTSRA